MMYFPSHEFQVMTIDSYKGTKTVTIGIRAVDPRIGGDHPFQSQIEDFFLNLQKQKNESSMKQIQQVVSFLPRSNFLKFDGLHPRPWIVKCNRRFSVLKNLADKEKITWSATHFEGRASLWYYDFTSKKCDVSWHDFCEILLARFEQYNETQIVDKLSKLKFMGNYVDYVGQYEELMVSMQGVFGDSFDEDYYVESFIKGLTHDLSSELKMANPSSWQQAVEFGQRYLEAIEANNRVPDDNVGSFDGVGLNCMTDALKETSTTSILHRELSLANIVIRITEGNMVATIPLGSAQESLKFRDKKTRAAAMKYMCFGGDRMLHYPIENVSTSSLLKEDLTKTLEGSQMKTWKDSVKRKAMPGESHGLIWLEQDLCIFAFNVCDTGQVSRRLGEKNNHLEYMLNYSCAIDTEECMSAEWGIRPLAHDMSKHATLLHWAAGFLEHGEAVLCAWRRLKGSLAEVKRICVETKRHISFTTTQMLQIEAAITNAQGVEAIVMFVGEFKYGREEEPTILIHEQHRTSSQMVQNQGENADLSRGKTARYRSLKFDNLTSLLAVCENRNIMSQFVDDPILIQIDMKTVGDRPRLEIISKRMEGISCRIKLQPGLTVHPNLHKSLSKRLTCDQLYQKQQPFTQTTVDPWQYFEVSSHIYRLRIMLQWASKEEVKLHFLAGTITNLIFPFLWLSRKKGGDLLPFIVLLETISGCFLGITVVFLFEQHVIQIGIQLLIRWGHESLDLSGWRCCCENGSDFSKLDGGIQSQRNRRVSLQHDTEDEDGWLMVTKAKHEEGFYCGLETILDLCSRRYISWLVKAFEFDPWGQGPQNRRGIVMRMGDSDGRMEGGGDIDADLSGSSSRIEKEEARQFTLS